MEIYEIKGREIDKNISKPVLLRSCHRTNDIKINRLNGEI